MMRLALRMLVVLIAVVLMATLYRYGTLDPCRMLAKDLATDSYASMTAAIGIDPGSTPDAVETLTRMATSQLSQGECVMRLKDRWLGIEKPRH